MHCPKKTHPEWLLEFAGGSSIKNGKEETDDAQSFTGTQSVAKDVDCILVWDEKRQAYILDRLSSSFSLKFDRKQTKLSKEAKEILLMQPKQRGRSSGRTSALGLDIPEQELEEEAAIVDEEEEEEGQDTEMHPVGKSHEKEEEDEEDSDELAKQLEREMEEMDTDQRASTNQGGEKESEFSPDRTKTGLGLVGAHGHLMNQEEVITPRGSPYLDKTSRLHNSNTQNGPASGPTSAIISNSTQMRSTPGMSPLSVANSPRPTGLESSLSATWRPPAQRSNVAMAYDEDDEEEEEDDDESEDDEEEEEEDEAANENAIGSREAADDDDLDAFARELEGSLMEPPTPVEEERSASSIVKGRRSSTRTKR